MENPYLLMRPSNVLARLPKDSKACIVGVREFLLLPESLRRVLLFAPVLAEAAIPGLLFAAREARVPIGLSVPFRPGERKPTDVVFENVLNEIERTEHSYPVFIQGGPFRLGEGLSFAQMAEHVFRFVDGGATLVSIDASRLPLSEQATAYLRILDEVGAIDFGLEVAVPLDDRRSPSAGGLEYVLSELKLHHVSPSFVRVASWQLVPPEDQSGGVNFSVLEELRTTCKRFDSELAIEEVHPNGAATASSWGKEGVLKLDAVGAFSEILFRRIDADERPLWLRRGWPLGLPGVEWLALRPDTWTDWAPNVQKTAEAIAYSETTAWLEALDVRDWSLALVDYWHSQRTT